MRPNRMPNWRISPVQGLDRIAHRFNGGLTGSDEPKSPVRDDTSSFFDTRTLILDLVFPFGSLVDSVWNSVPVLTEDDYAAFE
jgi:hypothetical protein